MESRVTQSHRVTLWSAVAGVLVLVLASASLVLGGLAQAQDDGTIDYAENGTGPVATYTATDPEGAMIRWSLGGASADADHDADLFTIENGVLSFKKSPDYEAPKGGTAGTSNIYSVTVKATDETMKVGMKTVTVEVTNVDEPGKVTLSARRPQTDTAFTAMITDPDGMVSNAKWQWAKAGLKNGSYRNIDKATSATYTPKDADSSSYLRATVTYEDPQGENKSAMMKSEFPSQRITGGNNAPEFDDDQDPVMPDDQEDAERSVAENTEAGKTVGSPVVATDDDNDTITYTLTDADGGTGGDSASFSIDWGTGQILTKGALNHEGKETYTVVVRATDPSGIPGASSAETANSDVVTVTITVTDVNEAPGVSETPEAGLTFAETSGAIDTALHTYVATDPDEGAPDSTWSVDGADGSKFTILGGELKFQKKPDYEMPTDANKDNVYEVTVQASDAKLTGMRKVMVEVTNEDEDGVVTLSKVQPVVGIPVTASLTDPDGGISKLTWKWTDDSDGDLGGTDTTSDTYKPVAGDVGKKLKATASYHDGHSTPGAADSDKKMADKVEDNAVERDTRNKAPVFGDEDPDTDGVQNSMATRKVEENTKANAADDSAETDNSADNVGAAVAATDTKADGTAETLTYSLGGADAAKFRVRQDGKIEVHGDTDLDYETKKTYMVTVMAEDPLGASASIPVTIMVTDLDEMPDVSGDEEVDYRENGTGQVARYTATDPEGAMIRWSLGGASADADHDADLFTIENGVLSFKKSPDYEAPKGGTAGTSNIYSVTVKATDETMKVGMKTVTVEVTNVDEPGKVTLSARRPQTDTAFTAMITDPDGMVSNAKWQWAKAGLKNGSYRNIDKATSATYTPKDADSSSYLRATVTYEDPQGENKSAMMKSEFPSQRITGGNNAPEFDDDQDPVMPDDQEDAERSVAENTEAGKTVGSPVVATDDDNDTITYTLTDADGGTGGDSASFSIDWGTGQILTKGALNHEGKETYTVVVRATDPSGIPGASSAETANSDVVTVTITVTDVNEAPGVSETPEAGLTFAETSGAIDTALHTYVATDPDEGAPDSTWSVDGADGSKFTILGGELKFQKKPDYEMPTDANKDNVYEVTVQASDAKLTGMRKVMVEVTNEDEDGVVTLSKVQPVVGIPVTASLTDPDGGISKLTWKWTDDSDGDLGGTDTTSDTYKPVAGDVGKKLKATASYHDGHSTPGAADSDKKMADKVEDNAVERDTRNKAPVFGDEDPDTDGVQNSMATRKVEENTKANAADDSAETDNSADNVGAAVAATDTKADGTAETLTYSLGGADAAKFRVRQDGKIEVHGDTDLDYETKKTYMVTVMAEDPLGASASIPVTIMVTDLDEMPEIMVGGLAISGPSAKDYDETGTDAVATYTAAGPNAASARWTLEGDDRGDFMIEGSGASVMLKFRSSPNYEDAADADEDNTYIVTLKANDGTYMDTHDVTVTVTNVDEVWTITETGDEVTVIISTQNPMVDSPISAGLQDPDGIVPGSVTWQWEVSADKTTWTTGAGTTTDTSGADTEDIKTSSYTPAAADEGKYLRVTASYTDGHGPNKTGQAVSTGMVTVGDPLLARYDANDNGEIEKSEVITAINEYLDGGEGAPSKADVIELINLYLGD